MTTTPEEWRADCELADAFVLGFKTPRRFEAISRRGAAIHEAGHIVASNYVFQPTWGDIRRIEPRTLSNGLTITQWIGSVDMYADDLSLRDQRLIGVAGAVAEEVWDGSGVTGIDAIYESMSPSDCTLYNDDGDFASRFDFDTATWREKTAWQNAVTRVHKLFNRNTGQLWPEVLWVARKLIVASRTELKVAA